VLEEPILINVHAYLKQGILLNSTSINLNCVTLPPPLILSHGEVGQTDIGNDVYTLDFGTC